MTFKIGKWLPHQLGHYAFMAFVIIAMAVGILSPWLPRTAIASAAIVLGIFGIVVGLANITAKETTEFLVASLVFLIGTSALTRLATSLDRYYAPLGTVIDNGLLLAVAFVFPAAFIVALKAIWVLASKK